MLVEGISDGAISEGPEWEQIGRLGSKTVRLESRGIAIPPLLHVVPKNISLINRSIQYKPMDSVGGSASGNTDKDGNVEVTIEGHISTKSDNGNTSVSASGEVTMDSQGNISGGGQVSIEHEF